MSAKAIMGSDSSPQLAKYPCRLSNSKYKNKANKWLMQNRLVSIQIGVALITYITVRQGKWTLCSQHLIIVFIDFAAVLNSIYYCSCSLGNTCWWLDLNNLHQSEWSEGWLACTRYSKDASTSMSLMLFNTIIYPPWEKPSKVHKFNRVEFGQT